MALVRHVRSFVVCQPAGFIADRTAMVYTRMTALDQTTGGALINTPPELNGGQLQKGRTVDQNLSVPCPLWGHERT